MEVAPQVYQITRMMCNVFLVAEEELTLIDTGWRGSARRILDSVQKLGRSPEEITLIIITHHHPDHTGSLAELKRLTNAKVALHKADAQYFTGKLKEPPLFKGWYRPLNLLLWPILLFLRPKPADVDIILEDGDELPELGGLRVIHTPGHTPGSISLFSPKRRLIFTGDTTACFLPGRLSGPLRIFSFDMAQGRESVEKLAQLEFDILCMGHGSAVTQGAREKVQKLV